MRQHDGKEGKDREIIGEHVQGNAGKTDERLGSGGVLCVAVDGCGKQYFFPLGAVPPTCRLESFLASCTIASAS